MGLTADVRATFSTEGAEAFTVDAALDVADGETLVVLGPSGSGKSLLLETVAGFHSHEGSVTRDGERIDDHPPEARGFGFVFQDYALFPHMTVRENVEFGHRYHEAVRDADTLLADLGVGALTDRYPPTLSGGEKQRVALARALAVTPEVLLLDEPLAALDVPTRRALREDLADALADVTAVYVTHNRTTARALADRLAVVCDGRVVQTGTPEDVFERPVSSTVAAFTGANTIALSDAPSVRSLVDDTSGRVAIRPEAVTITPEGEVPGTVERVVREEATHRVTLAVDDTTVEAFATDPPAVGEAVRLLLPHDRLHPCGE